MDVAVAVVADIPFSAGDGTLKAATLLPLTDIPARRKSRSKAGDLDRSAKISTKNAIPVFQAI